MVETITPVVHGGSRGKWARTLILHVLGATLSAAVFGAALAMVGAWLGGPWGKGGLLLLAALSGIYAAREIGRLPIPVPQIRRQVPEWWRSAFSPGLAGFLYGVGLGIGFLTFLRHATLVAVAVASFVSADPVVGAAVLAPFGIARALSVAVVGAAGTTENVRRVVLRLERIAESVLPRAANGVALLLLAVVSGLSAARMGPGDALPLVALALAVAFGWSAAAKAARPGPWSEELRSFRLGRVFEAVARPGVPAMEALLALLFVAGLVRPAAAVAIVLLSVYSLAIVRARLLHGPRLSCGCFGRTTVRDYRVLLLRNAAMAAASALAARSDARAVLLGLDVPRGAEIVPVALAGLGLFLLGWALWQAAALLPSGR